MKVCNYLQILEWNGTKQPLINGPTLLVTNRLGDRRIVRLEFEGNAIEVSADELIAAIHNAGNVK